MALYLSILLVCTMATQAIGDPAILFNRVRSFNWIYDDRGTGADADVSIWHPYDNQAGYCALGDVAHASHSKPELSSVTVKGVKSGAVAHPTGFSEIWNDRGSGGTYDVRIMKMNAPYGYTCLGNVAVLGYSNQPDKNKYCCVKSSYVTRVQIELVWKDKGSGATEDVSIWQVLKGSAVDGVESNNFLSRRAWAQPSDTPYLLKSSDDVVNSISILSTQTRAINVYETTELEKIWADHGSGANKDVTFYRVGYPDGLFSLGDIAVDSYTNKPRMAYMVKAVDADALRRPVDFRERWNDKGSGADKDVRLYEPVCPGGYRGLGHVAINSYSDRPAYDDIMCVKLEHTIGGRWGYIWNDRGSGAHWDVTIWQANPYSSSGQGLTAMSAVRHYGNMDRTAYVLRASSVNYYREKPAKKYRFESVTYDLDSREVLQVAPDSLGVTVLSNRNDLKQEVTRVITYTYTETQSWSNTFGLEIGVSAEFSAGVPLIGKTKFTVSVKASYSHTWGGQNTETKTDQIRAGVAVPPKSQITATVTAKRYKADVPYTAILIKEYYDGTTARSTIKGIYRGVNINEIQVDYSPSSPIA